MKLSDYEINSALRERLQMPTGRHLYAILGSYVALERYERVSFSQALGADGKPLERPINLNRELLRRIPDSDLKELVQNEAKRPQSVKQRLADWIRQCRRAGLFDQGRALYEKGGLNLEHLNETEQIEAEDDYRICVRRGATTETKPRRKRRSTQDE
jgi:hypothetical protein